MVSGPIWTDFGPNKMSSGFFKNGLNGQLDASVFNRPGVAGAVL